MKTKEFIARVVEEGLEIEGSIATIYIFNDGEEIALVRQDEMYSINTRFSGYNEMPTETKSKLFNLITAYASTPVDKREEPKKYYIRQKYIEDDWNYLNFNLDTEEWGINSDHETNIFRAQFTLSELPEWVHEMLEQGHLVKEEVEDE